MNDASQTHPSGIEVGTGTVTLTGQPSGALEGPQVEQVRRLYLDQLAATLPQTLDAARVGAHAALLRYRNVNAEKRAAIERWAALDKLGGSVRVQCAQSLMVAEYRDEPAAPGGQQLVRAALTQSAADKAASDHPTYMAHKAELSRLAREKETAEDAATEAFETLQNAREYLRAFIAARMGEYMFIPAEGVLGGK